MLESDNSEWAYLLTLAVVFLGSIGLGYVFAALCDWVPQWWRARRDGSEQKRTSGGSDGRT